MSTSRMPARAEAPRGVPGNERLAAHFHQEAWGGESVIGRMRSPAGPAASSIAFHVRVSAAALQAGRDLPRLSRRRQLCQHALPRGTTRVAPSSA